MSYNRDPTKEIPTGLNKSTIFRGYTLKELGIISVPALISWYLGQFLPSPLSDYRIVFGFIGILFGVAATWRTPDHLEPTEWLYGYFQFATTPDEIDHVRLEGEMARPQKDIVKADTLKLSKRTQDVHGIKRIHMRNNALELEDGKMIAAIEATSVLNMALASDEKWEIAVDAWENYINNTITYPIQLHVRAVPFNVRKYIDDYESRMEDEDIRSRPIMKEILRSFLSWYPNYLSKYGTNEKEFYIIFKADAANINKVDYKEKTIREGLFEVPLIGKYIGKNPEDINLSDAEKRSLMVNELNNRCQTAMRQGIGQIDQIETRRVTGTELAFLNKEFWQGRELEQSETNQVPPSNTGAVESTGEAIDSMEVLEREQDRR